MHISDYSAHAVALACGWNRPTTALPNLASVQRLACIGQVSLKVASLAFLSLEVTSSVQRPACIERVSLRVASSVLSALQLEMTSWPKALSPDVLQELTAVESCGTLGEVVGQTLAAASPQRLSRCLAPCVADHSNLAALGRDLLLHLRCDSAGAAPATSWL